MSELTPERIEQIPQGESLHTSAAQAPLPTHHIVMKLGDQGAQVQALENRLVELHELSAENATGVYSEAVAAAVHHFQAAHHLKRKDSIAGHETLTALNHAMAEIIDPAHESTAHPTIHAEHETTIRPAQYNIAPSVEEYRAALIHKAHKDAEHNMDNHDGRFTGGVVNDAQGEPIPWCAGYASHLRAQICNEASEGKIHLPIVLGARANGEQLAAMFQAYHTKSHLNHEGSSQGYVVTEGDSLVMNRGGGGKGHITQIVAIDKKNHTFTCIGGNEPPHYRVEQHVYSFNDANILGVIDEGKIYQEECRHHGLEVAKNAQDYDAQVASRVAVTERVASIAPRHSVVEVAQAPAMQISPTHGKTPPLIER